MTPQERIEQAMLELWGERNVTRLARESGVDRASLSKILNEKRGIGKDVAAKVGPVLKLTPDLLLPPEAVRVTLATVYRSLEEFRGEAELSRGAMAEALAAIGRTLARIERRLPPEAEPGREAQR